MLSLIRQRLAPRSFYRAFSTMSFTLPALPYPADALEPHISAKTFSFHHGKHHNTYVTNLNKFVAGTDLEKESLESVIVKAAAANNKPVFNNAAQHFNHSFFWESLKPQGGGLPASGSKIAEKINADFGSFDAFKEQFKTTAATHFGSGWAWLVFNPESNKLQVVGTHDADTPVAHGLVPIVTIDVWEHAYYLDYQNRRPDFVDAFLTHMVNWEFAEANLNKVAKL